MATGQVRVWGRVGRLDHRVIDGEFKEKKSDQDQLPR
jgi:hypothetical protein